MLRRSCSRIAASPLCRALGPGKVPGVPECQAEVRVGTSPRASPRQQRPVRLRKKAGWLFDLKMGLFRRVERVCLASACPRAGSPGRREAGTACARFRLNTGLVVTAGRPRKSESQLPDLSKLKTQEVNGHMSSHTHTSVTWWCPAGGWGRGRHQSPLRAHPQQGSAQVMPGLPASPSALSICETSQPRNALLPRQPALAGSAFIPPSLLLSLRLPEQGHSPRRRHSPVLGWGRSSPGRLANEGAIT